jgi:hypothetical protein
MFKIAVRRLDDEKFHDLPEQYKTREAAEEAVSHMLVQVRLNGELIRPEEFEIRAVST